MVDESLKPRALIVDDFPGTLKGLTKFLAANGWRPIGARDILDARRYLDSAARVVPDVILTDLMLENELGSLLIGLVRLIDRPGSVSGKPVRVIGYTSLPPEDPEVESAIRAGVDAVVFKPGDLDVLLKVMTGEHPGDVPIAPRPPGPLIPKEFRP